MRLNAASFTELTAVTEQRAHPVDDYVAYLHRRWNEGERAATGLFREIRQRDYPGGELAVQRYLRRFRKGLGHAPHPGPKSPSVRQAMSWIMTRPDHLDPRDATKLHELRPPAEELRDRGPGEIEILDSWRTESPSRSRRQSPDLHMDRVEEIAG
jgi:hypothetical protein